MLTRLLSSAVAIQRWIACSDLKISVKFGISLLKLGLDLLSKVLGQVGTTHFVQAVAS